jgi:hypothetical protein
MQYLQKKYLGNLIFLLHNKHFQNYTIHKLFLHKFDERFSNFAEFTLQ